MMLSKLVMVSSLFVMSFKSCHKLHASYIRFHLVVLSFYGNLLVQGEALMEALCGKDIPAKVYVGMRYWHPFTEEAIEQVGSFYMFFTLVWFILCLFDSMTQKLKCSNLEIILKRYLVHIHTSFWI